MKSRTKPLLRFWHHVLAAAIAVVVVGSCVEGEDALALAGGETLSCAMIWP